ncbi:hypothetical protein OV208_22695 [Corallococcus sp. bb12-1]|uniref:hypothetical protein n=1 Tax=Corallococcus sp. bb12-1 TaxID=2996784 RepID=UPI0022701AC7|nr:hypothetical protein [Corallococcus sp. bb12-1]MCY1044144.1 hypothetical protein [Corallococcus sp. bb12-1]
MILYRPVGVEELLLIYRSGLRCFPPRLPGQPIFYPVLNEEYAIQIARDWNAAGEGLVGYVMVFDVDDEYSKLFEPHQVGGRIHQELWVPAEALDEFNSHIQGIIRLAAAYFGPGFVGRVPNAFSLRGKDAGAQLEALRGIHRYSLMDFHGEVVANHETVFAHFPYWEQHVAMDAPRNAEGTALLAAIRRVWAGAFPSIPLGVQARTLPS